MVVMVGHIEAASTPETLLFESIGEMVSGLSYSHTIIAVPIDELRLQIIDYKRALEHEFNVDTLRNIYHQAVRNSTEKLDLPLSFEKSVFKKWMKIGATHLMEADQLLQRVQLFYEVLPDERDPPETEDRETNNFRRPAPPDTEWRSKGTPIERTYEEALKRPSLRRPKRALPFMALGAAALVFGGSGTLFGWLGFRGSSRVYDQLNIISQRQDQLVRINEQILKSMAQMEKEITALLIQNALEDQFEPSVLLARLRTHIGHLHDRVAQHEHLLQQLQHRRLAIDFLDEQALNLLFHQVDRRARSVGFQLLLNRPAEIFQVEVSHFFNGSTLSVVLHLPIAPEDSSMRLFKLHPFPLPFDNDTFLIPNVGQDVLAVSNSNFRYTSQMSAVDLLSCQKINKLYLCERNGVLNKHPEDSCLGALYTQKFELARRICPFSVQPSREYIHQLMNNWFLIHLQEPLTVPVLCSNSTHMEWHLRPGITRQHLGAGCIADFPRHRLLSDISVLLPQDYVQFDMDWDPVSFMPDVRDQIIPEFKKLERLGATNIDLSTLQSLVTNQMDTPPLFHNIHFGFNTVALITSLGILSLGLYRCCVIRKARRKAAREAQMREAVRVALMSPAKSAPLYDDECPQYPPTLTPVSGKFSQIGSQSNVQLYPKANDP